MAKRTKKVGAMGRYGPRYGVRDRVRTRDIEIKQKKFHTCPNCGHPKVKRAGTSLWQCRKCMTKFAGGAYFPKTDAAIGVEKLIQGVVEKLKTANVEEEA
jgi:large subunit ribosomal protein L37Ae